MVTGPTRVCTHELPQVKAQNNRSHTNSTQNSIDLICICCVTSAMPDTTIQFTAGCRTVHGCCVGGQASHFGVSQKTLQVEVPDGPDGQHCQTNCPADNDVARQWLGESVPVKLECYQNLGDNDGDQQQGLCADLLAVTTQPTLLKLASR